MRWVMRSGYAVLAACVPLLAGVPGTLAVLLLMPVVVECCRTAGERPTCLAAMGAFCAVCCWMQPGAAVPVLAWCATGAGMCLVHRGSARQRGAYWAALCLAMLCGLLAWVSLRHPGDIFTWMAERVTAWVDAQDSSDALLMQCYQMGFSRLEEDNQLLVGLLGNLGITPEVRQELLNSLRTTLEELLPGLLPQAAVAWVLLTAVLTAALPDVIRRMRGQKAQLSPFGEWRPDAPLRRCLNLMALGYLLELIGTSAVTVTLGSMCAAVFRYGYMLLGLAVLEGITKKAGTARALRLLWMAVLLLLAPVLLVILGIADRHLDPRRLRRSTEDEGGIEQ